MTKVCIILNSKHEHTAKRLADLYMNEDGADCYFVEFKNGFSKLVENDTDEILFGGGEAVHLKKNPLLKKEAFNFITTTNVPMMGICFGAQLIARALGSRIVFLPHLATGLHSIRILRDKADFGGRYMAMVYKNQNWSLQDLPDELDIIACSRDGIEMFQHTSRQIAGVQFHPEQFSHASDGRELFQKLRKKMLQTPAR